MRKYEEKETLTRNKMRVQARRGKKDKEGSKGKKARKIQRKENTKGGEEKSTVKKEE